MNVHIANHRLRFALGHLALSALVISAFTVFVLQVWYPPPLGRLEGVYPILMMLVGVDVCVGPLLTLVVASPIKPRRSLYRDLTIIGMVRIAALGYGAVFNLHRPSGFHRVQRRPVRCRYPRRTRLAQRESADDRRFRSVPLFGPVWAHALPPVREQDRLELMLGSVEGGPDTKNLPDLFHSWPAPSAIGAVRSRLSTIAETRVTRRRAKGRDHGGTRAHGRFRR